MTLTLSLMTGCPLFHLHTFTLIPIHIGQAAFMVMAHLGGKLMLFQSAAPSLGIGKIKARDNPQLYGTDKEATIRNPDDPFYKRFAAECSKAQISVDIFSFSSQYMDLASMAALSRYTCGNVSICTLCMCTTHTFVFLMYHKVLEVSSKFSLGFD